MGQTWAYPKLELRCHHGNGPFISGPARSWWGAHRPGQWWSLPAARQEDTTLRGILRCWRNVREVLSQDIYCDLLVEGHNVLITFTLIFTDICIYIQYIYTQVRTQIHTRTHTNMYMSIMCVYIYICTSICVLATCMWSHALHASAASRTLSLLRDVGSKRGSDHENDLELTDLSVLSSDLDKT